MEHWEPDSSEVPPDVEYPFVVCAHKYKKEVPTFKEAEAIARTLVYQGKRVEILYDDVVVGKARETQDGFLSWDIHPNGTHREVLSEPKQLTGGKRMAKWVLDTGGRTRTTFISLEDKIKALSEKKKGMTPEQILGPLYKSGNKELPKNLSIIFSNWSKSIQDRLDAGDEFVLQLCQQYGIVREASEEEQFEEPEEEEAPAQSQAPARKPGRPPARK